MSGEGGVTESRGVIQAVKWMIAGLALICLLNIPYLPGPDFLYEIGWGVHLITGFSAIISVLLWLPGIFILLADLVFRRGISRVSLYLIFIPVFMLFCVFLSQAVFDRIAIKYTIHESAILIAAIEKFKSDVGTYPESLSILTPTYLEEIPMPIVIGIRTFEYIRTDSTYELSFADGFTDFFTSDVTYDPALFDVAEEMRGLFPLYLPKGWRIFGRNT